MILISVLMMFSSKAIAWDKHQVLMERMVESRAAKRRIYPYREITIPCPEEEKKQLDIIAKDLHFDGSKVPLITGPFCKPGEKYSRILLSDLLTSSVIDEPDQGMDQNLPESEDPNHYRRWMGGETGPTSQGYRHMYFPGIELISPIKTLQIPTHAIGESLDRIKKFRAESDAYFAKGDRFWGARILLWELHYVQDLNQPFHVVQIPSIHYLQWSKIFTGIAKAATHAIGNYHYAFEGVAYELMKSAPTSEFKDCFEIAPLDTPGPSFGDPKELLTGPRAVGNELGFEIYQLFGDTLKSEEIDLPNGVGPVDYFELTKMSEPTVLIPDELSQLSKEDLFAYTRHRAQWNAINNVKRITCDLVKTISQETWDELDRCFLKLPPLTNIISAKTAK